ncbi:MAG: hypothetical protein LQ348_007719, partial [Seirophora lacunosa]
MRPDDEIYMMVEDEFLSTAHLFTSHLHHAEYMRLKTLARSSSSAAGNPLLPARQQRPTDSITAMRAETLRKKQADAKTARNKAALEQMKQDARGGIDVPPSPDLSSPSEFESEEAKHPWAGTSLQGLMAPDARTQQKNLTSLRGMQGIKSSTRAAKG